MLIYLVDNTIDGRGEPQRVTSGPRPTTPEAEILTEPFREVSLERVRGLNPPISSLAAKATLGKITPRIRYSVFEVIHEASQPILGVCGVINRLLSLMEPQST